jgi:hypothetical protein
MVNAVTGPSRRRFVQGLALGGAAAALGLRRRAALASPPVLTGSEFDLDIGGVRIWL